MSTVILEVKKVKGGALAVRIPKLLAREAGLLNSVLNFNPRLELPHKVAAWLLKDLRYSKNFEIVENKKPLEKTIDAPVKINLNTATGNQLKEAFPFLTEETVSNILAQRETELFTAIDDLMSVENIGKATFAKMKDRLSIED